MRGAIPSFDDGGSPPDPSTSPPPDMGGGGFGGGDTTPQPPAPNAAPPWGQSLGSDVGKVGSAISGAIPEGGLEPNSGAIGPDTGDAMSQKIQGIKDYISGKGAMPKDQFEEMNKAVDPRGTMDQNERSMRMLDATANDPAQGAAVIQALRQHWDVQRGNAAKLLTEGNATMAASEMSKGFQYVPDGTKTMVTPNKDGFTFTTHTMDGQDTTNYMDANQTKQFLTGAHGLFDHVVGQSAGTVLSSLSPPPPSGGGASAEAGGPPKDSFADTQVGDVPQAQKKGYPPENPATQGGGGGGGGQRPAYDPRADDPNALYGQNVPGSKQKPGGGHDPAYTEWLKAQENRNQVLSSNDSGGMTPQQNKANWDANQGKGAAPGAAPAGGGGNGAPWQRKPTFTNPDNKTDDEINSPVNVVRGSAKGRSVEGAATAPSGTSEDLKSLARQMHPGDAQKQAEFYEQQRSIAQEQANKLDIAKNTRYYGSQATAAGRNIDSANRAGSVVQAAQIKADQMAAGTTDKTAAENLRTASTILGNQMKGASGGDAGAAIKALRAGGVSENLIGQLVNPAPGPARAQGQGRRLGGAPTQQPAQQQYPQPPPEALQMLKDHPETANHFDAIFGPGASQRQSGQ
jgi:hypothetical protein